MRTAAASRRPGGGSFTAYSHEIDEAYEILTALKLAPVCHRPTRELAYGQQRLLEIALALATRPKVLLLDEPAAGVPREESKELFAAIAGLSRDITVLFIEHDMDLVFRFASARHRDGRRPRSARRHAARDRGRSARARGLSRQGRRKAPMGCAMTEPLLALDDVRAGYGSAVVLDGISFELPERGSLAVLGRNGVGKSTLLLTIMGNTQVGRGRVLWRGADITRSAAASPRARRHRLGGAGARDFSVPDRRREPHRRRARRPLGPGRRSTICFRGSPSAGATSAISFPAASSRCWRSRAR